MSRRTGTTDGEQEASSVALPDNGQQKQAVLLSQETGHFSLIRYGQFCG